MTVNDNKKEYIINFLREILKRTIPSDSLKPLNNIYILFLSEKDKIDELIEILKKNEIYFDLNFALTLFKEKSKKFTEIIAREELLP